MRSTCSRRWRSRPQPPPDDPAKDAPEGAARRRPPASPTCRSGAPDTGPSRTPHHPDHDRDYVRAKVNILPQQFAGNRVAVAELACRLRAVDAESGPRHRGAWQRPCSLSVRPAWVDDSSRSIGMVQRGESDEHHSAASPAGTDGQSPSTGLGASRSTHQSCSAPTDADGLGYSSASVSHSLRSPHSA